MAKVYARTLGLCGYDLSTGHQEALVKSIPYFENFVERLFLDSCGIKDIQAAKIFEELQT